MPLPRFPPFRSGALAAVAAAVVLPLLPLHPTPAAAWQPVVGLEGWVSPSYLVSTNPDLEPYHVQLQVQSAPGGVIGQEEATAHVFAGFGAALTDSSAYVLAGPGGLRATDPGGYRALLDRLYGPSGLRWLRLPVAASDYTAGAAYTYDDVAPGATDPTLAHFSIAHDNAYVLPAAADIEARQPSLKVIAAPWSAPAWMKSTGALNGGAVKPALFPAYARYLGAFLDAYQAAGVHVDELAIQNEPGVYLGQAPAGDMAPADQVAFARDQLAPVLAPRHTGFLAGDNLLAAADGTPMLAPAAKALAADPATRALVTHLSVHCYAGDLAGAASFGWPWLVGECSGGIGQYGRDIAVAAIDAAGAGAEAVLFWNLALDSSWGPIPDGVGQSYGCNLPPRECRPLVVTAGSAAYYQPEWFAAAHIDQFVTLPAPARRISFGPTSAAHGVVFEQGGRRVAVVANVGDRQAVFGLPVCPGAGGPSMLVRLAGHSTGTYRWPAPACPSPSDGDPHDGGPLTCSACAPAAGAPPAAPAVISAAEGPTPVSVSAPPTTGHGTGDTGRAGAPQDAPQDVPQDVPQVAPQVAPQPGEPGRRHPSSARRMRQF